MIRDIADWRMEDGDTNSNSTNITNSTNIPTVPTTQLRCSYLQQPSHLCYSGLQLVNVEQGLGEADGWREDCNQTPAQHPAHNREGHSCVVFIFDFITEPKHLISNKNRKYDRLLSQRIHFFLCTFPCCHKNTLLSLFLFITSPRVHSLLSLVTISGCPNLRLRDRGCEDEEEASSGRSRVLMMPGPGAGAGLGA